MASVGAWYRIGVADEGFAKSTPHEAIKALSAETLEAMNRLYYLTHC
jgi:hypothetical protein